jgi:hypothetical protein
VLLDTGAGISDVVLFTVSLADDVLIVATPEPTSLTDAYATIKVLATTQPARDALLVNQVQKAGRGPQRARAAAAGARPLRLARLDGTGAAAACWARCRRCRGARGGAAPPAAARVRAARGPWPRQAARLAAATRLTGSCHRGLTAPMQDDDVHGPR